MSADELAEHISRTLQREFGPGPGAAKEEATTSAAAADLVAPVAAVVDYAIYGVHLELRVRPPEVVAAARLLDEQGFALDAVTGQDWLAEGQMEVIYDFFHPTDGMRVAARARIPRETPAIPTIGEVFPGAWWHERETHDFFGIRFDGHPNLTPLLLPEDATYHPLRKDFKGE